MAFGQQSGPPASATQIRELLALLNDAGHSDFRDARGPMGFTQRQAGGKFTRDEATAFIAQLQDAGSDGSMAVTPPAWRQSAQEQTMKAFSSQQLADELRRRGWVVIEHLERSRIRRIGVSVPYGVAMSGRGRHVAWAVIEVRTRPESVGMGLLLAGVGGYLDAFTYVGYRGVFANAQTGNIVLLGVNIQAGHWQEALLHVPPIIAFTLGIALAQVLAQPKIRKAVGRPTRWVLLAEIAVLAVVGATSGSVAIRVVPAVIAFVAAAQVSTFRSLDGVEYSSTLTTSNLHHMIRNLFQWRTSRDAAARHRVAILASVLVAFAIGACVGALCTRLIDQRAAWIAAAVLLLVLAAIVIETRRIGRRGSLTRESGKGAGSQ